MTAETWVSITKDLLTKGTATAVILYGMYRVGQLVDVHAITGEAGMVIFVALTSAAAGYLFASGTSRDQQKAADNAFDKGLAVPTAPTDSGTIVTGDNTTVTDSGPTTVTSPTTPTVTRNTP